MFVPCLIHTNWTRANLSMRLMILVSHSEVRACRRLPASSSKGVCTATIGAINYNAEMHWAMITASIKSQACHVEGPWPKLKRLCTLCKWHYGNDIWWLFVNTNRVYSLHRHHLGPIQSEHVRPCLLTILAGPHARRQASWVGFNCECVEPSVPAGASLYNLELSTLGIGSISSK